MIKYSIIFILLFFNGLLFSQVNPRSENLSLAVDYALFKKDIDNSYLELYYSFSPKILTKTDNGRVTELIMHVSVKNINTNQVEINNTWNLRNQVQDTLTSDGFLVGLNRFILNIGNYSISLVCFDKYNRSVSDSLEFKVVIPPFKENIVAMSDIEICNSIKEIPKDTLNIFYKNTFEIKPNPTSIIHYSYPLFGYYIECYNLTTKDIGASLYTGYKVVDNFGKEYLSKSFKKQLRNITSVETGIVNLNNLPGGSFNFVFSILDSNNKPLVQRQKKFFIYNPSKAIVPSAKELDMENEFSLLSESEIDKFFQQSKYIARREELDQFTLIKGVDAKRNFLIRFWDKRKSNEEINKTMYEKRIKFANERYRTKFKEGWFTERGRVTLTYGIPEETFLQRGKEDRNGKPFEIWYYPSILNGVYFVFIDETGFNDFRLVHSSHNNEVHDQYWQTYLKEKN